MKELNKLAVFGMCVDNSEERFKELIGPSFDEFNSFYWALRDSSIDINDIEDIQCRKAGPSFQFTIFATEEAKKRMTGTGFSKQNQGITIHIPITKGV